MLYCAARGKGCQSPFLTTAMNKPIHSLSLLTLAALLALLTACQGLGGADKVAEAEAGEGLVVAAQPLAALAAQEVLQAGGNAADAAVAAGFAIAVVEQTMNSIGGRSQILVRVPAATSAAARYYAYNGMTEIPAAYTRPAEPVRNGYGVIATPGVVSALTRLHAEHGSLPWAQLLQPAIAYARDGFEVLPGEAARHLQALADIKANPGFQQAILKPDGTTHGAGEILRQPQLAATLSQLAAHGGQAFYEGELAAAIAADMQANGGYVTAADLANYQTLDGRYISLDYRGYQIHTIAAPAGGGLVVKALNIMQQFDLARLSDPAWAAVSIRPSPLRLKV